MGKNLVLGYTPTGQPVVYMFPSRNTGPLEIQRTMHVFFMLERALDLMADGVTTVTLVIKFDETRQGPRMTAKVVSHIFRCVADHYPWMLGRTVVHKLPRLIRAFTRLFWPFIDAPLREIVTFTSTTVAEAKAVDNDQLLKDCGGDLDVSRPSLCVSWNRPNRLYLQ